MLILYNTDIQPLFILFKKERRAAGSHRSRSTDKSGCVGIVGIVNMVGN